MPAWVLRKIKAFEFTGWEAPPTYSAGLVFRLVLLGLTLSSQKDWSHTVYNGTEDWQGVTMCNDVSMTIGGVVSMLSSLDQNGL